MSTKNSLSRHSLTTLASICFVLLLIPGAISLFLIIHGYKQNRDLIEKNNYSREKIVLKKTVLNEVAYINQLSIESEDNYRTELRDTVNSVFAAAEEIYLNRWGSNSVISMRQILVDRIKSSITHSKSYPVFILSDQGKEITPFTVAEADPLDIAAFCKKSGEGYYTTGRVKTGSSTSPSIIYTRYFQPLRICIGVSVSETEIEQKIRAKIIDYFSLRNSTRDNYFFAATYSGLSLAGLAPGQNLLEALDKDGEPVVKKMIETARGGGGFLEYNFPELEGFDSKHKISYIHPVFDESWFLAYGKYLEDIDSGIKPQKSRLHANYMQQLTILITIIFIFSLFIVYIAFTISKRIAHQFSAFSGQYTRASETREEMDVSELIFSEFKELARLSNTIVLKERESEEKLIKSLKEKEILIKEIHHRVKNNLQIISSLIGLQANYTNNQTTLTILKETSSRIRSMGIIHEKIYQTKDLTEVRAQDYISTIVDELFYSYSVNQNIIEMVKNIDNISFTMDTAIPLGLIINELLTNSIKHAFKENQKGIIRVSLKDFDNRIEIIVSDNGIGIPIKEEMEKRSRLGMQLIQGLTSQLNAELTIVAKNGTKTKITIQK
ncbi:MAG: cache domain-containing protein [Spirochaetes bacterium]|jgi:two-component sensor histidine kinase|nr:cache domain-containing protein [Spirochaetota bacterium]